MESVISVLGIEWDLHNDTIFIRSTSPVDITSTIAKRNVLSIISQLFDPLGFLLPLTVKLRWFFQSVNKVIPDWDTHLSECHVNEFMEHLEELKNIPSLHIDRMLCPKLENNISLHIFSDTSQIYGSCAYLKTNNCNEFKLIWVKVKTSSKGDVSIPKVELAVHLYEILKQFDQLMFIFGQTPSQH